MAVEVIEEPVNGGGEGSVPIGGEPIGRMPTGNKPIGRMPTGSLLSSESESAISLP